VTRPGAVAIALDGALCDTRPLWEDWLEATTAVLGIEPDELPSDRAEAAAELDRRGAGNWRTLLGRWSEERAPVYVRRDAATSRALRALEARGVRIGVYTDAPEELARVTLSHLGLDGRIAALETGSSARECVLARLGDGAQVVETRDQLLELAT
jgi:phosphoglycolate phosphatase-like HAD superfamily hydrolase